MSPTVETVRGPVPVDRLGPTLTHEHLVVSSTEFARDYPDRAWPGGRDAALASVVAQLRAVRERGISTIVDCTALHHGRDMAFVAEANAAVPELKTQVYQEVARELDRAENEGRPNVTVIVEPQSSDQPSSDTDPNFEGVDFGEVRYMNEKKRTITVANTGQVEAKMQFVDRPIGESEDGGVSPSWLVISFDRNGERSTGSPSDEYVLQPASRTVTESNAQQDIAPEPLLPNYGVGKIRPYTQDINMLCVT